MAKKDTKAFETPDYEKLTTVDEVDAAIQKHKDILVGKDTTESMIKAEKKDYVSAMNGQLKELNEEREHEIGVLGALNDRRKQLSRVIQMPTGRSSGS